MKNNSLKQLALSVTLVATLSAYSQHAVATEAAAPASGGSVSSSTTAAPGSTAQAAVPVSKRHPITADKVAEQRKHIARATSFSASTEADLEFLGIFDKLQPSSTMIQALQKGGMFRLPDSRNIKLTYYYGDTTSPMGGFPTLASPYVGEQGGVYRLCDLVSSLTSNPGGTFLVFSITGIQPQPGGGFVLDPVNTISKPTSMVLVVYCDLYGLPTLPFIAMFG